MEKAILERIKLVMRKYGETKNSLSIKCGMNSSTLGRYINGENKITISLVRSILDVHPEVSADWLIQGQGEMMKSISELPTVDVSSEDRINESAELGKITRKYNEAAEMIEQLKKKVALLEKTLEEERKDKERAIAQLDLASSLLRERLMMAESSKKVG